MVAAVAGAGARVVARNVVRPWLLVGITEIIVASTLLGVVLALRGALVPEPAIVTTASAAATSAAAAATARVGRAAIGAGLVAGLTAVEAEAVVYPT